MVTVALYHFFLTAGYAAGNFKVSGVRVNFIQLSAIGCGRVLDRAL